MLQAILLNKAGRSISSKEVHWKELFSTSEDSLTSTIFGTLLYLPRELFWKILIKSCYACEIEVNSNKIESIKYWPRWNASNTKNTKFVEPDIFIQTSDFDLIVEAKRYDYDQQYNSQWENEFSAYLNQYGETNKKVFLLAIGGITSTEKEFIKLNGKTLEVIKSRWSRLLREIKLLKKLIDKDNDYKNNDSISTIIEDLIIGFRIHGYVTGEWFENTNFKPLLNLDNASFSFYNNNPFKYKYITWSLQKLSFLKINDASLKYFNTFK